MRVFELALVSVLAITAPMFARQWAEAGLGASRSGHGVKSSAGMGPWCFGRALGRCRRPPPSRSRRMERAADCPSLGAKPLLRRVLLLWRSAGPYLLGLGSWERRLRLPLR